MSTRIPNPYDNYRRGTEDSRGRQRQQVVASTRRSRSAEGARPQYKDPRRNFLSPNRASAETLALYNTHTMPLSEPNFHDLDEMRLQHSRSLSPAYPRRLTSTPYDPFLIERQDNDLYQRYAEEAYSQRYAKTYSTKSNRKETTDALLMFNDAFETGSALTGWSEQELIKKKSKDESKRAKAYYGKKKKAREARILNIPAALKRNTVSSELPVIVERKRYYRGADGPSGAMSREIVERRTAPIAKPETQTREIVERRTAPITKPETQTRSRSRTIASAFSRSSDMESTQSSNEGPEAVSNAAVRRWMQTKENRKQLSDFPLLSTRSFELASTPKDAPGPVARRPSPDLHDPIRNRFETPEEPIEQLRLSTEKRRHGASRNASASFESEWTQSNPDVKDSADHDRYLHFSGYSGTGLNSSFDVPDDGSPTSVVSSQAFKQRSSFHRTADENRKPKSILRNSPRSPARRVDGTYPLSNRKDMWKERNENLPRRVQTRFSDKVEQRMYDNHNEESDVSGAEEESNYFNNYGNQGFSLSKVNQANEMDDPFELEKLADELLGRAHFTHGKGYTVGSVESKENDDNTEISKPPPSDGFVDADGMTLSPIRSEVNSVLDDTIDPVYYGTPELLGRKKSSTLQSIDSLERDLREMAPDFSSGAQSRNASDRYKRSSVPTPAPFEKEDRWLEMDDEDYTIADDEFDNSGELAFIQVVAAVVIQTAVRRFLAILVFERLIEAHFKSIAGPDLMEPVVVSQPRATFQDPPERLKKTISSLPRPDPPTQYRRENLQLLMVSAITIQRIFRGWWVRDSLHVDRYCAILIQRMVRGFLARTNFYYDMYRIILVQSYVRMLLAREIAAERLASIVAIQARFRGRLARKCTRGSVSERKFQVAEHVAAIKIQSICRSFLFHERYLNTLADILIVQSMARRWIVRTRVIPHLTTSDSFKHGHSGRARECRNDERRSPFVDVMNRRMISPGAVAGLSSPSIKRSDDTSRNTAQIFKAGNAAFSDSRPGSDDPLSPLQATSNRIRMVRSVGVPSGGKLNAKSPLSDQTISRSNVEITARSLSYEEKPAPMQYRPSLAASYEEPPQPYRLAVRAAREAVQREANQVGPDDEISSAIVSSSRRKVPKNSAAAFWEQKTASQPKPMFPPKGWR
jgi:hypothetical protein